MRGLRPSYVRVRRRAEEVLQWCESPPVDLDAVARRLDVEIRRMDLEPDVSGILYRTPERRVIVVNAAQSLARQRFSIAHEIGHLLLHRGEAVHVDAGFKVNLRDARSSSAEDVEEVEANAFAANLLMPADWLRQDVEHSSLDLADDDALSALAARYGVSTQALAFRLATLSR